MEKERDPNYHYINDKLRVHKDTGTKERYNFKTGWYSIKKKES